MIYADGSFTLLESLVSLWGFRESKDTQQFFLNLERCISALTNQSPIMKNMLNRGIVEISQIEEAAQNFQKLKTLAEEQKPLGEIIFKILETLPQPLLVIRFKVKNPNV